MNPYEPESICRSIETAVQLGTAERAHRMRALHRTVSTNDIHWWTTTFLDMIEHAASPLALAAQS